MDDDDKITPEYIVAQAKILTDEELLCLIENYGDQERDDASYWANKTHRD